MMTELQPAINVVESNVSNSTLRARAKAFVFIKLQPPNSSTATSTTTSTTNSITTSSDNDNCDATFCNHHQQHHHEWPFLTLAAHNNPLPYDDDVHRASYACVASSHDDGCSSAIPVKWNMNSKISNRANNSSNNNSKHHAYRSTRNSRRSSSFTTAASSSSHYSNRFRNASTAPHHHQSNLTISASSTHQPTKNILCANCGGIGHVYRVCSHPVTSFGIICFRWAWDAESATHRAQYLMVRRKDSLCYVEFIRGKYDVQDVAYISRLFDNMTKDEQTRIKTVPFDRLWYSFWQADCNKNYMKEYCTAREKFERLKTGFIHEDTHVDLASLLHCCRPGYDETEWGFPKGRRNINESDVKCALREFNEESGYNTRHIELLQDFRSMEEVFIGCNHVRYRHVYFVAEFVGQHDIPSTVDNHDGVVYDDARGCPLYSPKELHQVIDNTQGREISKIAWLSYEQALEHIREHNTERKGLFTLVNQYLLQNSHRHGNRIQSTPGSRIKAGGGGGGGQRSGTRSGTRLYGAAGSRSGSSASRSSRKSTSSPVESISQ